MTKLLLSTVAAALLCAALDTAAIAAPIAAPEPVKASNAALQDARWVTRCHRWRHHRHWHRSCHRVHVHRY